MTSSNTVAQTDINDDLPAPVGQSNQVPFVSGLPRPVPSIADTGRISFGAGFRLPVTK